ncbi:hemocyte protein-glutamine gamma-glutamyltransferase-like protein, partial [Leptotrombidium deliense]
RRENRDQFSESKLSITVPSHDSQGFQFFRAPISKTTVSADVWIPETAPIGVWRFNIIITTTRSKQVYSTPKIYILFNPWSPLDDVYMPDVSQLEEYVGNEVGFLYEGEYTNVHTREKDFVLDRIVEDKKNLGKDDYWNYHVWTEAWMKRRDLTPVDIGWQATDGTPQEPSDTGMYQMGPASVNLIREAKVNHPSDAWFIYSEVNADLLDWKKDEHGDFKKVGLPKTDFIGKFVLTKNVFPSYLAGTVKQHNDITLNYKPREGTPEERASFREACRQFGVTPYLRPTLKREAVEDPIILGIQTANTLIGQPLLINIVVLNKWFLPRSVDVNVKVCSNYYDGKIKANINDKSMRLKLNANEERHLRMVLKPEDYLPKLEQNGLLKIVASADVIGSNSYSFSSRDFIFTKPSLSIENYKRHLKVGEDEIFRIRLQNPLPYELTYCQVHLQGLCANHKIIYLRNIGVGENYVLRELLYYEYDCFETLVINLSCNELNDIRGYVMFQVSGNSMVSTQTNINNQFKNPMMNIALKQQLLHQQQPIYG